MLLLRPRLHTIAQQVPQGAHFADIGSDHAFLPIYLLQVGRIPSAIALDLHAGPLERGRREARRWGLCDRDIVFRLGDGLRGLSANEADTIAIAGMGGDTIAQCLDGVAWSRMGGHLFLLQPMSSVMELRLWLSQNNFCIEAEQLTVEQNRRYVSMRVRVGHMPLTDAECWVGRQWKGMVQEERLRYLDDALERRVRVVEGLRRAKAAYDETLDKQTLLLCELEQMRKEWISWQV